MSWILASVGAVLVVVILVDMVWTTVAATAGAGPVTRRVSRGLWWLVRRAGEREGNHRFLRLGGVGVVSSVFVLWVTVLVLGWTLIFASSPEAVIDVSSGQPATLMERLYFAGYAAATLGNGGFAPGPGLWQVLTVLATFSGLGVATMAITYLVPVGSAVVARRTVALQISALGGDPAAIVKTARRDRDWHAFDRQLETLGARITELGQQHLAYPVVHYFHDVDRPAAAAVNIAVLDETLTLLEHGLAPEERPSPVTLRSVRNAIGSLLSALEGGYIRGVADVDVPPFASLARLRRAGVPVVTDEVFAARLEEIGDRRRTLRAFLEDDGWDWSAVHGPPSDDASDTGDAVSSKHLTGPR